jgi:hypothetical protein
MLFFSTNTMSLAAARQLGDQLLAPQDLSEAEGAERYTPYCTPGVVLVFNLSSGMAKDDKGSLFYFVLTDKLSSTWRTR